MFQFFSKFFVNMKRLLETTAWFSFIFYLLTGFVIAILIGQSFFKVSARQNLQLDRFDPDVRPVIEVLHNPPLIAKSDEKVKLEFNFVCGYIIDTRSCCKPSELSS
jgi:hypothetical protein